MLLPLEVSPKIYKDLHWSWLIEKRCWWWWLVRTVVRGRTWWLMLCYNEDEDTWDMGILGLGGTMMIIISNTFNDMLNLNYWCFGFLVQRTNAVALLLWLKTLSIEHLLIFILNCTNPCNAHKELWRGLA